MTTEELYGVLSYAKITPEQKKRRRACFVKRFETLLKPEGFSSVSLETKEKNLHFCRFLWS